MKITHYDLFAGIGGFSLALDTIFYEQKNKHIFCEWEAFPTAVLKKHWPNGTYYGDIADLVADTHGQRRARFGKQDQGRHGLLSGEIPSKKKEMVIVTGGFPCQPFSQAGRRQGTADDRYKWPEMFAVIRNVRPDWVIAENVRGLVTWNDGMVLETVCADLESEGYEVQPIIIPAVAVGAPHRRDRVWIVANLRSKKPRGLPSSEREEVSKTGEPDTSATADPRQQLREQGSGEGMEDNTTIGSTCTKTNQRKHQYTWANDWREVAFATCYDRVDDGLPRKLDGATLRGKVTNTISASQHRKLRLKACGNAIVPKVAMEIFKAIKTAL